MAFSSNDIPTIMKFLEYKCNLNIINDNNQTPLAFANNDVLY